jgi:iron complex outermembrane receptor protein
MGFRPYLLASSAMLAAFVGASAHAQSSANTNTIAELVVTAEKREQSLQDVPVAISAFTSEQRDIVGIQSIQDMTNFTPGLQYSTSTDRVSLRGLGRLTNVLSADASVANYADGVYETFAVRAGSSTLFLDRVEVLRGPQGTLYGRNSIAGAINILSRRPTDTPYAEARATYGNYNRSVLEAAASGPINDQVKFRVAANWERQSKGWAKNIVPGMPSEGNVLDTFYGEVQLDVKFSERVEMWTKLGYTNWRNGAGGPGAASGGWSPYIYDLNGAIRPDVSATNRNGGNGWDISQFYDAASHFNPGFGCSGLAVNVVGAGPNPCVNASNESPWLFNRPQSYTVRVPNAYTVASHWTYHADTFDIRYIVGGTRYWYHLNGSTPNGTRDPSILQYSLNSAVGGAPLVVYPQERFDYQERNGFISNELNFVSTKDGPFQWIAGAYFYHQAYKQPVSTTEDPRQVQWRSTPPAVCASGGQTSLPVTATCVPGNGRRFDNRPDVKNTSYAFYGQASYELSSKLTLTGGIRYSHDRKYGTESTRILCFGLPACVGLPPEVFPLLIDLTGPAAGVVATGQGGAGINRLDRGVEGRTTYDPATGFASREYDASWSAVTGTAKAEWTPDDDTLVYGSYARGYRSGGFNIGIFTVISQLPYSDKESVDSFELGMKRTWGSSLQTNFAIYNYDYQNLQIPITRIAGTAIGSTTTSFYNVPKARSRGFEAEILWQPLQNLQIIGTYAYIDAKIREGAAVDGVDRTAIQPGAQPLLTFAQCAGNAACAVDDFTAGLPNNGFIREQSLKGGDLPNAPRHKFAIAANYTWEFEPGSLTANISYAWRDKAYGGLFKRWYYEAPSWDQVDARVLWKSDDDKYEFIGYVKNIFDTIGYDQGATAERLHGGYSSVYGAQPVAGLTCSPVAGAAGTVNCVQGIRKTFYVTPPRTYGVELRYKFF